jgi:transposase
MMFSPSEVRVYVAVGSVDMRKNIDGLSMLVAREFNLDPFGGQLFVFGNRRRNMMKVLYWDRNGFCLWQKRLERDRFRWPESGTEILELEPRQLQWLLDGLDPRQVGHRRLHYQQIF